MRLALCLHAVLLGAALASCSGAAVAAMPRHHSEPARPRIATTHDQSAASVSGEGASSEPHDWEPGAFDEQLLTNVTDADDSPDQTGDEGATPQLIDHADDMWQGAQEVARRVQRICLLLASSLIAVGVLVMMFGGIGGGAGPNPARIVSFAMLGVIGILVWPEVMLRTKELADSAARYIDTFQFDGQQHGIASATVRTFDDMGKGIEKSFEKSFFWTIIVAPYTQGLVYLAWFLAIFFYALYRFVWQVGWLFLSIVGPFGMAAASTGTPMGIKIAKGTYMSVLNLACWPIGISILFALLNLGIHDYAQDPTSIGGKQAMVALIVALMIPVTLAFVKVFLSGGGLDTNLASFASQMTVMATLGALQMAATALSAVPGVSGPLAAGFGRLAASAKSAMSGKAAGVGDDVSAAEGGGASSRGTGTRAVAPMPANDGARRWSSGDSPTSGQSSSGAGAAFREAGAAALGAIGRTAWTGGATIANMAGAAADAGARESGHIRPMYFPMSPPSSRHARRSPTAGRARGSSAGATTSSPGEPPSGGPPASDGGPSGGFGVDGSSTSGQIDADVATGSHHEEAHATNQASGTEATVPPTERVVRPAGKAMGSNARAGVPAAPRPADRGLGAGTASGLAPAGATAGSANLTGAVRIPSLDDLGLGGVFSSAPESAAASSPSRTQASRTTFGAASSSDRAGAGVGETPRTETAGAEGAGFGPGTFTTVELDDGASNARTASSAPSRPNGRAPARPGAPSGRSGGADAGSAIGHSAPSGRAAASPLPANGGATSAAPTSRAVPAAPSDAAEPHDVVEIVSVGDSGYDDTAVRGESYVASADEPPPDLRVSSPRARAINRIISNAAERTRSREARNEDPANEATGRRPPDSAY